jgi:putative hydrolase of the HAD superfamily
MRPAVPGCDAVLFDLDDTLVIDERTSHDAFLAVGTLASESHGVDPLALRDAVRRLAREMWTAHPLWEWIDRIGISSREALWGRFEGSSPELAELRAWVPGYRLAVWSGALAEQGVTDEALALHLADAFWHERRARYPLFGDTLRCVDRLRSEGRVRLGLVTNGLACLQREKLAGSGLGSYFEAVVVAGDVGIGKPDPLPFHAALDALATEPGRAIMIGNRLERDVAGARAAGVRAVWIDRDGTPAEGAHPDLRICSLDELAQLV